MTPLAMMRRALLLALLTGCSPLPPSTLTRAAEAPASATASPPVASAPAAPAAPLDPAADEGPPCGAGRKAIERLPSPIELPEVGVEGEEALGPFLDRWIEALAGRRREPLRVLVYGDSNIAADWTTGGLRRSLQGALGDAGHGFVALGRPWPGYAHMDVKPEFAGRGWEVFAISTRPPADRRTGFGGIAIESHGAGVKVAVGTAGESAGVGRAASHMGFLYTKGPGRGSFEVTIDGQSKGTVEGEGEAGAGLWWQRLDDGPHRAVLTTRTRRPVRVLGAVLEREGPGVVVDSVGVASSISPTMLSQENETYAQALALRGHDLVIFTHGSFDVKPWNPADKHQAAVRGLIALHRRALPGVSVLVTSPVDYRGPLGESRYSPAVAAAENRAIARENQAAFWDLRGAMGGDHAIQRWHRRGMADADHIHLNARGGLVLGNRLALALEAAMARRLARRCEARSAPGSRSPEPATGP